MNACMNICMCMYVYKVVCRPETVTRITRECVLAFAREGCIYLELRSTPRRDALTARQYVDAVKE